MLLLMLERRMPIDMVLTADTGMESPFSGTGRRYGTASIVCIAASYAV